ncbi:hypothetical protein ABZP36_021415 [Zizania latifolia]
MTIVEMQMNIDCDGCEDNVRKALLRLQGVDYVFMDRTRGKVTVTGSTSQKKVLRAARRKGRLAVLWPSAYDTEHHYRHHAYYAQPQPAAYYHYHHHQAKPVAVEHAHHYYEQQYSSVLHGKSGGGGGGWAAQARHHSKASSYNYRVHGYFDSDLHGYSHHHDHADVVPVAARSYFSDENPHACAIM